MPGHASHKNYRKVFDAMTPNSTDVLKLRVLDGAFSNGRFVTMEILDAKHILNEFLVSGHCFVHVANLVAVAVTKYAFQELYTEMYITAKWLHMSSYYLRCLYAVNTVVLAKVRIEHGEPDPQWQRVGVVIIGLVRGWHKRGAIYKEFVGARPTWVQDLEWCFAFVFTGPLIPDSNGYWVHRCRGEDCCDGGRATTVRKWLVALLRCILRCRPPVPVLSRWTLTSPCLDFYVLAVTVLCILRPLVGLCRQAIKRRVQNAEEAGASAETLILLIILNPYISRKCLIVNSCAVLPCHQASMRRLAPRIRNS
jgi:hypothetical protein